MAKDFNSFMGDNPNVLFDLRQTYAMQILTPILLEIAEQRRNNNFQRWFDELTTNLYTEVNQKLTPDEKKEYENEYNKAVIEINKYPYTFSGSDKTPEKFYKVKSVILKLEMWIKEKMEERGLYGKGSEYDWDEI